MAVAVWLRFQLYFREMALSILRRYQMPLRLRALAASRPHGGLKYASSPYNSTSVNNVKISFLSRPALISKPPQTQSRQYTTVDSGRSSLSVTSATGSRTGNLDVTWTDDSVTSYPFVWLRDNCQCPACFHPVSRARGNLLADLDLYMVPEKARFTAYNIRKRLITQEATGNVALILATSISVLYPNTCRDTNLCLPTMKIFTKYNNTYMKLLRACIASLLSLHILLSLQIEIDSDDRKLEVRWPDGHVSPFEFEWLIKRRFTRQAFVERTSWYPCKPVTWGGEMQNNIQQTKFQTVGHAVPGTVTFSISCILIPVRWRIVRAPGSVTYMYSREPGSKPVVV